MAHAVILNNQEFYLRIKDNTKRVNECVNENGQDENCQKIALYINITEIIFLRKDLVIVCKKQKNHLRSLKLRRLKSLTITFGQMCFAIGVSWLC